MVTASRCRVNGARSGMPRGRRAGRHYPGRMDEYETALEIASAIRAMDVSPLEVLDACLQRVDERNPALNAVIWRNDEDARGEAKRLGDRIAVGVDDLPPFAGVPLPIKDLLPVAGQPVTYGSRRSSDRCEPCE